MLPNHIEQSYSYKPRLLNLAYGIVFFGTCAGLMMHSALTNTSGIMINGLRQLPVETATVLFWTLSILSICFVTVAIAALIVHRRIRQSIRLTDAGVALPKSRFSGESIMIAYDDIQGVDDGRVGRERFLTIRHPSGKFDLAASMLPNRSDFDTIRTTIRRRLDM